MDKSLPYRISVLCYLFNESGRVLLLHRHKPPNQNLFSPIGGKLDQGCGESPLACALREIQEETGLDLEPSDLHLAGMVSETNYCDEAHWLMFLYEARKPVHVQQMSCNEGRFEWIDVSAIKSLALPETDRHVIWPLFWQYRKRFFAVHIDCSGPAMRWRLEQPAEVAGHVESTQQSLTPNR